MKLGVLVGLGPSHTMLDGDPVPRKRGTAPNFRPMSVVAKRLDGLRYHNWYGGRPLPRIHCVKGGPSSAAPERGTAAPTFRPMSIVAKGLDASAYDLVLR